MEDEGRRSKVEAGQIHKKLEVLSLPMLGTLGK